MNFLILSLLVGDPVSMPAPAILAGPDAKPVATMPAPMPGSYPPSADYTWRALPGVGFGWVHKDIKTPVQTVVQAVTHPVRTVAPVVQNAGRWVKQCVNGVCQMVFVRD